MDRRGREPAVFRSLGDGRICQVTNVGHVTLRVLRDAYLGIASPDPAGFVTALLSHSVVIREIKHSEGALELVGRQLPYHEAAELSEADRTLLRSALAASFGRTHVSISNTPSDRQLADELKGAGLLSDPAPSKPPATLLRSFLDTCEEWNARLRHVTRGVDPLLIAEAVSETVSETLDELRRELDLVRQQPLFFVVADLPVSTVRELLFASPQDIERLIADRVLTDHDLLNQVGAAVKTAPHLGEPQREDLRRGLDALRKSDPYACRQLMSGLEGALWLTASASGVIDDQRRLVHSKQPQRLYAKGLGALLRKDGGLPVGTDLAIFLLGVVFDDRGNDIRHGRAIFGHESASIWAYIGLLGWLDTYAATSFMTDVTTHLQAVA